MLVSTNTAGAIRWWTDEYKGEGRALAVNQCADYTDMRTRPRQTTIIDSYTLYGGESSAFWLDRVIDSPLSDNVIATVTDSVVAEVTLNEPSPMVQTWGADYDEQERSEKLTQYLATAFEHFDGFRLWRQCVKDAIIAGLGCMRAVRVGDEVSFERIHPLSILIDDRACIDVAPREIYIRRAIAREHLQALYPEFADKIEHAAKPNSLHWVGLDSYSDVVGIYEAWHLPSVPGADDGIHCVVTNNCTLHESVYDRPRFPLAFIRAIEASRGFWGESRVQRMAPIQTELNKQLRRQQDSMHLMSVPRVWVRTGTTPVYTFNNDIGAIIESDEQPQFIPPPPAIGPEGLQFVADLRQRIYAVGGSSELAASLVKPAGLDSGRSQRIFREWGTRLHANFAKESGRAVALCGEDFIMLQREIAEEKAERGESHKIYYMAKDGVPSVDDWTAIDVDRDRLRVTVAAINALSRDPAERVGQLRDLVVDGIITPKEFLRSIGTNDFDQIRQEVDAPEDLIRKQLANMLSGSNDYSPPEPYQDLTAALRIGAQELQLAEIRGCPQERCENIRRWLLDVKALLDQAMTPPQPPPGSEMGPGAMETAPTAGELGIPEMPVA